MPQPHEPHHADRVRILAGAPDHDDRGAYVVIEGSCYVALATYGQPARLCRARYHSDGSTTLRVIGDTFDRLDLAVDAGRRYADWERDEPEKWFAYLIIAEDGTSREHRRRIHDDDSADTMVRAGVGGWIELIRVADPALLVWCDEDGLPRRRQPNPIGSRLVALLGGRPARYVGPLVVTGDRDNTTVSLTDAQLERLHAALRLCRD